MPRRPLLRRLTAALLILLLVAGAGVWLARDLPRRIVERRLAAGLDARVRLGGLEIESARSFVLRDVRLDRFAAWPPIAELRFAEVRVESPLRQLFAGHFESVRLIGGEARLVPAPLPPPRAGEPGTTVIDELVLEPLAVTIEAVTIDADEETAHLTAQGTVRHFGQDVSGEIELRSPEAAVAPILALLIPDTSPLFGGRLSEAVGSYRFAQGDDTMQLTARAAVVEALERRLELPGLRADVTFPEAAGAAIAATVKAERAVLHLAEQRLDLGPPQLTAAITPPAGDATVVHVDLRPRLALFADAHLAVDWDSDAGSFRAVDGQLRGLRVGELWPALAATADLTVGGTGERLTAELTLRPRRLTLPGGALEVTAGDGARLDATAEVPLNALLATARPPSVSIPFTAALELPAASGRAGEVALPARAFPLRVAARGALAFDPADAAPWSVDGHAELRSRAVGKVIVDGAVATKEAGPDAAPPDADLTWRWQEVDLALARPLLAELGMTLPAELTVAGTAAAHGTLQGPLTAPVVRAAVSASRLSVTDDTAGSDTAGSDTAGDGGWRVDGERLRAQVTWHGGTGSVEVRGLEAAGALTLPPLAPLPFTAGGRVRTDAALAAGKVSEAVVELGDHGKVRVDGGWRRSPQGSPEGNAEIRVEALPVATWQATLRPWLDTGALDFAGAASAELTASLAADGGWQLAGDAQVEDAGFTSADGSRVMEGLDTRWTVTADGRGSSHVAFSADGRSGGFQLLWGTFYGDFSQVAADLELTGEADLGAAPDAAPWRAELRATVPEGPALAVTAASAEPGGAQADGAVAYTLSLDVADLGTTHARYLSQVLRDTFGDVELDGRVEVRLHGELAAAEDGAAEADAAGGAVAGTVAGTVRLDDLRWQSADGLARISGFSLDLPVDLRLPAGNSASGERRDGRVRFARLAVGGLELPPTDSRLWVEGDSLGIEEPIELSILDGSVTLQSLTLHRLFTADRYLETGLRLADVSLERISDTLGLFPIAGTLAGELPRVRLTTDELQVEGGGTVQVFGGVVEVGDISGRDILTRFPRIRLSARFRDVDLQQLTRRLDFGEMTGLVEGSLTDCELFGGVPVRFNARVESVEDRQVRRTIDVKAIKNLTILGTGTSTNIFDRGIQRFFKRYTYASLGFTVQLANDRLLIRGLERRGGQELFLRGRLPFPIDVVNAQPGKTASFQAMVARLQSLDFSNVTTSVGEGGEGGDGAP